MAFQHLLKIRVVFGIELLYGFSHCKQVIDIVSFLITFVVGFFAVHRFGNNDIVRRKNAKIIHL